MSRIGIISGGGKLPILIGEELIKNNYQVIFFLIKNFSDNNIYTQYENIEIELSSFSLILKSLEEKNIDKIIMAGKISRPSIRDIKFDFTTINLIKDYLLESKGDDQLLKTISNFFLKKGFPIFDWKNICKELFSDKDCLTIKQPSNYSLKNKIKGLRVFKIIGRGDIGQSLIIQNQLILGVESIEGTDELLKRCYNYKKNGDKGILLKLSKHNQHDNLDLPAIGINTVENAKKYNYDGIFIEKNNCIIIEKNKVIDFCNHNDLFLATVNKID